ncbi:hypothetical protein [Microbacterium sp.]|uniref:hypothetical protein n=1 Tax=Microbacterium sp. TaxID=51671 RepID=UPI0028526B17|nr:hypothetical protein [Microbacterium sp.]
MSSRNSAYSWGSLAEWQYSSTCGGQVMMRWLGESDRSLSAIAALEPAFCQMLLSTRYVVTGAP